MRCDEVTTLLPALVDGDAASTSTVERHIETCLRCQAELARYRRLLRTLALLRTRYVEPTPGLLGETLAAITDAAERRRAAHVALRAGASRTPAPSAAPPSATGGHRRRPDRPLARRVDAPRRLRASHG